MPGANSFSNKVLTPSAEIATTSKKHEASLTKASPGWGNHTDDRHDAQMRHIGKSQSQAQKGHATAQQGPRTKADAVRGLRPIGQKVESHAQQQRKRHCRRAVMLGQKLAAKAMVVARTTLPRWVVIQSPMRPRQGPSG